MDDLLGLLQNSYHQKMTLDRNKSICSSVVIMEEQSEDDGEYLLLEEENYHSILSDAFTYKYRV